MRWGAGRRGWITLTCSGCYCYLLSPFNSKTGLLGGGQSLGARYRKMKVKERLLLVSKNKSERKVARQPWIKRKSDLNNNEDFKGDLD